MRAPLVGTFYVAPAPGEPPFAAPGKQVKKGETLCLIEAMKMMSEVPGTRRLRGGGGPGRGRGAGGLPRPPVPHPEGVKLCSSAF